jgi:protein involved in polysaccharide export with SLBB domain
VVIKGEVRNPKIFELKNGDNLATVIKYAGGFNEIAYSKAIKIDSLL